jgi:signal transduction histidine kinase
VLAQEICEQFPPSETPNVKLSGGKDMMVHADSERIGRVLTNLISNALKYAPDTPEIKVELIENDAFFKVSVTDQGPGISPEKTPLLFDAITRLKIRIPYIPDLAWDCLFAPISSANMTVKSV